VVRGKGGNRDVHVCAEAAADSNNRAGGIQFNPHICLRTDFKANIK